jgi:carbonic anhydrase/acetyltransferase-like protein (isoleucine patch superfamily)
MKNRNGKCQMILPYKDTIPDISPDAFVAPNATVIGDVRIAAGASIWYGAVVRGDLAPIRIGANTNIQDNCTLHTDVDKPAIIGENVTVGHNAIVHGCTVAPNTLIGMNAVILSGAHVKTGTIIAAGAVVKEGAIVGPFQLLAGMPATVKKELSEEILDLLKLPVAEYLKLAKDHLQALNQQH